MEKLKACQKLMSLDDAIKQKCDACHKPAWACAECLKEVGMPKPTNADRIRSMSNEELAVALMCPNEMGMAEIECDHSDDKNCCQCLLDWLRKPEQK